MLNEQAQSLNKSYFPMRIRIIGNAQEGDVVMICNTPQDIPSGHSVIVEQCNVKTNEV